MKENELRIGNLIYHDDLIEYDKYEIHIVDAESFYRIQKFPYSYMGIELTEEWLLKFGFEKTPHFTVNNAIIKKIGRRKHLSIEYVGTPNEMVWLCYMDDENSEFIDDLVCVHNFDYDGKLHVHQLQNLYFALTGEELKLNT